jgi:hypothetical protein
MFSAIQREYEMIKSLNRVETECIDRLEKLVMGESHDAAQYRKWILDKLNEKFSDCDGDSDEGFVKNGRCFTETIDTFITLCISVRKLHHQSPLDSNADNTSNHSEDYIASVLDLMRYPHRISCQGLLGRVGIVVSL